MKSDGSDSATTLAGNDYEPEEDLNQACVSLLRFFLHFYPPWEVVFRVILFILSGMNILLIWVSFKKQKQNWDATRFFIITTAVMDIMCLVAISVPALLHIFQFEDDDSARLISKVLKIYIILLAFPKAMLSVFLLAGFHRFRFIMNKPRPSRLSLTLQVIAVLIISEGGLMGSIIFATSTGFRLYYHYRVLISIQVLLIVLNIAIHGLIYRKSKSVANKMAIYKSDDVNLESNQSYDVVAELGKKIAVSFAMVAITSSFLCVPNLFFLAASELDISRTQMPCLAVSFILLVELASFNCVINPWIYYMTSYEFKTIVNCYLYKLSRGLLCKQAATDE